MNILRQLLRPPLHDLDNEDSRLARLLHTLLLGVLVTNFAVFPLTLFAAKPLVLVLAIHSLVFALAVLLLVILRSGNIHLAGGLIVLFMNLAGMGANVLLGRPFSVISVLGILSLVVVGLLASRRSLILVLVFSVVLAAITGYINLSNLHSLAQARIALFDAIVYIWASIFGGFLAYLSITELRQAFDAVRQARQQLVHQNVHLRESMVHSEALRQRQGDFTSKLREVMNATNDLMQCATLDELWRASIVLAREHIGLDRCSIFLFDDAHQQLRGTYGTSRYGNIVDEHDNVFALSDTSIVQNLLRSPQDNDAIWEVNSDAELNEWKEGHRVMFGRGWMVNTLIRPKAGMPLAVFFNDVGLSNQPLEPDKQELLAVFCSILANVAERKKAELHQSRFASGLRQVLASTDELLRTRSLDEFWARASRLAQQRLGVERLSFYRLQDESSAAFRGTFGIDLAGQVVDCSSDYWLAPDLYADMKERRATTERLTWRIKQDRERVDLIDGKFHPVGRGWIVDIPIFSDNGQLIGVLFNDSAITNAPVDPEQQDLLVVYASLLGSMAERKMADERQRRVATGLRTVLDIANELLSVPQMDDLWRASIEMARERLGVERCSIYLLDPENGRLAGTYGTDIFHKTTDERDISFENDFLFDSIWRQRSSRGGKVWLVHDSVAHTTKTELGLRVMQRGWVVDTPIISADGKVLGVFYNDTAISRAPLDSDLQDAIAVYCTLLGSIAERKQVEGRLQNYNAALEKRVDERTRQLRRSEAYFRTLIHQSSDVITVIGLDGIIHFESPSSMQVFKHEGRIGQNIFELMHPDDVDQVAQAMVGQISLNTLPSKSFVVRVKCGDGSWAHTESHVSLLYDDDNQIRGIVVNSHDITERKRMEDAVRESEARFRNIANASPTLICTFDTQWQMDFANQAVLEFLGITSADIGSLTWPSLLHPQDRALFAASPMAHLAPGEQFTCELRLHESTGAYRWLMLTVAKRFGEAGQLLGYITAGMDVTQRKQMEDALRESEARFRDIANASPILIWTANNDLKFDFVSTAVLNFTGLSADQLLGDGWRDVLYTKSSFQNSLQTMAQLTPEQSFSVEFRVRQPDGQPRWLFLTTRKRYDGGGQQLGYIGAAVDITARKEVEQALEQRLAFEHLLADLSAYLGQLAPDQIDAGIDQVLARFSQFLGADVAAVIEVFEDGTCMARNEWISAALEKTAHQMMGRRRHLLESYGWWVDQINQHQIIAQNDIADLPAEAQGFQDRLRTRGVKSILDIPLLIEGQFMGELIFDSITEHRDWSDENVRMATVLADLIATSLKRKQAAEQLQRRLDMEQLVSFISGEFARLPATQVDHGIEYTLKLLGEALGADACRVIRSDHAKVHVPKVYEWYGSQAQPARPQWDKVVANRSAWEWIHQTLRDTGVFYFVRLADLPDEFARFIFENFNSLSAMAVPLSEDKQFVGVLTIESMTREVAWSTDDINLIKVIAENISSALARQKAYLALNQRLEFEQRVAEISAKFLSLPPERITEGIDFALKTLGEFTQVSICRVFEHFEDSLTKSNTNEWCAPGIASQKAPLQNMRLNLNSWWQKQLSTRQLIYYTSLSQMPVEAAAFVESLRSRGVRSLISIALVDGDKVLGELGLDSMISERAWTDEDARMLRLVSELIANAIVRRRAAAQIQMQVAAEQLIADISSNFVRQPVDQIDGVIYSALAALGQFVRVDFCSLYEISDDQRTWSNTHEWRAEFISSQSDLMQKRRFNPKQWWWAQLLSEHIIVLKDVATDQSVPEPVRQDLMSRGIRSTAAIAILQNGALIGELGLDLVMQTRAWSPDHIRLAELVADLIGNALERKRNAHALQKERDLLEARVIERTHELSKLLDVTKTVNSTLELQPLLNLILDQLKGVVAYDALTISEFNDDHSKVVIFEGPPTAHQLESDWTYDVEQDVHITEMIVHRHSVIVTDIHADTPFAAAVRRQFRHTGGYLSEHMQSLLYVPLVVRDRVIGMMALYSSARQFYNDHHARLAMAFANQAAVAIENARLHEQAVQSAALGERSRLARELHDSVSQALFGIVLGARTVMQNGRKSNDPRILEPMDYVLKLAESALAEMRALIFELRPESLQTEGLLVAFQKQSEALCARYRIEVQADLGDTEPPLPIAAKEALYRIGLEAIQNTIKHAGANHIDLRLRVLSDQVLLEIQDNGRGFDPDGKFPGHFGLYTMRERAEQLGGFFEIASLVQRGTTIRVRIPLQPERLTQTGQQPMTA